MRYSRLTKKQKDVVARAIGISLNGVAKDAMSLSRGYEAVKQPYASQRRPSLVEFTGEDGILRNNERNRIINLQRDMMRNSPTRVAQDQQIRVNVVGNVGGKLYANFPEGYGEAQAQVMHFINKEWSPECEFTYGHNFNWILKTTLTSMDVNGNVILVFDDGFLSGGKGTGKIRAFEGDEIANINPGDFKKHFPETYKQSQGFVYNELGQFVGCFVSTSQRGCETFADEKGYIVLKKPGAAGFGRTTAKRSLGLQDATINWVMMGDERRFNQGRAVSPLTAAITCLVDLHEITASETQAAKINAQLVGQILQSAESEGAGAMGAAFSDDVQTAETLPEMIEFTTKELSSIGARFDQMPEGMKIELLDTKRPNQNMEAYIEFLSGLCGGTRGLARVYSTLKAQTSYTAFRGEQVMTHPSFEEMQKDLERGVCDKMYRLAIKWAVDNGIITAELPEGWEYMLSCIWPKMREVSEADAQKALELKLKNGVTTLHRELQPGEYEKIMAERAKEVADFKAAGLQYPGSAEQSSGLQDGDRPSTIEPDLESETTEENKQSGEEAQEDK